MSHLQEVVKKNFLSGVLSTSGDTLKQLLVSTSTYALEQTKQRRRFTQRTFSFSFSRHFEGDLSYGSECETKIL